MHILPTPFINHYFKISQRHDIAEILLLLALIKHQEINQVYILF